MIPCGMRVPVAVWQLCELLYTCYLLTYYIWRAATRGAAVAGDSNASQRTATRRAACERPLMLLLSVRPSVPDVRCTLQDVAESSTVAAEYAVSSGGAPSCVHCVGPSLHAAISHQQAASPLADVGRLFPTGHLPPPT